MRADQASALVAAAAATWALGSAAWSRAQTADGAPRPAVIAIESVSIVDVVRGEIAGPRTILIVDGRITALSEPAAISIPATARRVDGRGQYLMPGLVDMHVHLFKQRDPPPAERLDFSAFHRQWRDRGP